MDGAKGKVVLFGKTGDGKSTVANVLVTGGIEDLKFRIGHGVKGCTSKMQTLEGRGWTVTDTVGLGEGEHGEVSSTKAEEMILEFLKKVKGHYSHVVYVKSAGNRFDVMDETIWFTFKRIFQGAEGAFTILFTKGTCGGEFEEEEWLEQNWDALPGWVKDLGRENVLITDIPPINATRPKTEQRNKETRRQSIVKLEEDLLKLSDHRGGKYFTPAISNMDDAQLKGEVKSILAYILAMLKKMYKPLKVTAKVLATVGSIVLTITPIFLS